MIRKRSKKQRKTGTTNKRLKNRFAERIFELARQFWSDLGIPGEACGEVSRRILERNFLIRKKKQKKRGEAGSLGGHRGPQQGGILGRITGGRGPTRLRPTGGRADCLRFASPAEATGGLEAWRLGGYIKKTIKNHKMDTEAAQMMPKSSQN